MSTSDFINKYRKEKVFDTIKYTLCTRAYTLAGMSIVNCRDARLLTGKYRDIALSDIFIFDPTYLTDYLIKNKYISDELKAIAQEIVKHQSSGIDDIKVNMALGRTENG